MRNHAALEAITISGPINSSIGTLNTETSAPRKLISLKIHLDYETARVLRIFDNVRRLVLAVTSSGPVLSALVNHPFLSNLAIERLNCSGSYGYDDSDYYRVLVNSAPQPLPTCADGPGTTCSTTFPLRQKQTAKSWPDWGAPSIPKR